MKSLKKENLLYTLFVFTFLLLVYFVTSYILKSKSIVAFEPGDFSSYYPDAKVKVIVYGTSWCPSCASTRDFLKSKRVDFIDYDIDHSDDAKRDYLRLGGKAVPLLLIGNRRLQGFNAKAVTDALEQLPQDPEVRSLN